jgi:transcriptional regulator with XRE-family HTH domain
MIPGMGDASGSGRDQVAIARRLQITRKALGLKQGEFADRAGIARNAYNQFDLGKRLLTLQRGHQLCDEYKLTLDWLFRGDPSALPSRLAAEIARIARRIEAEAKTDRKPATRPRRGPKRSSGP